MKTRILLSGLIILLANVISVNAKEFNTGCPKMIFNHQIVVLNIINN